MQRISLAISSRIRIENNTTISASNMGDQEIRGQHKLSFSQHTQDSEHHHSSFYLHTGFIFPERLEHIEAGFSFELFNQFSRTERLIDVVDGLHRDLMDALVAESMKLMDGEQHG